MSMKFIEITFSTITTLTIETHSSTSHNGQIIFGEQVVTDHIIPHQLVMLDQTEILSMTPQERRNPDIIKASRKTRIARGCGLSVQEVNKLLTQFEQMKKMMKLF